jgi:CubicO group peptidase (beta-lactamase class C family)
MTMERWSSYRGVPHPSSETGYRRGPMTPDDEVHRIVRALVDGEPLDGVEDRGLSLAVVVVHHGAVIAEGYGIRPDTVFGPGGPVEPETPLVSWSMAKSIAHSAVGIAVADGLVDLEAPASVPEWVGTPKESITLEDLLTMRSGLHFVEDYVDDTTSNCLEMLFGSGAADHAAYAAALDSDHPPGTVWNYSSGTTNIIARILGDVVGGGQEGMERFLADRLFDPLGMTTARARFDESGTWVASSYVDASAVDFARFGELYLADGIANGRRILPDGWVDHARHVRSIDPESGFGYGAHWWIWPDQPGSLVAQGYDGQLIIVLPALDAVAVHLGAWSADRRNGLVHTMRRLITAIERRSR